MRRLAIALVGAILVAGCGSSGTPIPSAPGPASNTPAPTDLLAPTDAPGPTITPGASPTASSGPVATPAPTKKPAGSRSYKVKKGDTLSGIAKKYGITLKALQAANPTVKATSLAIGTILTIPPKP